MTDRREDDHKMNGIDISMQLLHQKMDEHREKLSSVDSRLQALETDYTRYKGFIGGMIFVLTAIWAFLNFALDGLKESIARAFGFH